MDSNSFDRTTRGLAGTTSRRQALKLLGGGLLGGALAGTGFAAANNAAAQRPQQGTGVDVTGVVQSTSQTFAGTLTNLGATLNDTGDGFNIVGTIEGVLSGGGEVVDTFVGSLDIVGDPTCEILKLELGPLHLNILGLVIDLNEVVLNITAESGAGNLLGNLLCAVAGLLDNPSGQLNGIANLLNQILSLLG